MHKTIVFIVAIVLAANAQRIETEKSDRNKVVRVETAPNHLTIIELGEPVTEVAAGSSSYKIEWRGNKVFVQPLDPDATTNLFIWTASGRSSYELVPVPSVQETVFAIDQEPSPHVAKAAIPEKPAEDPRAAQEAKLASEMLLASTPVRLAGETRNRARVEVILKDIYRKDNRVYVRYEIQNKSRSAYLPGPPGVFTLRSPRSSTSLYTLSESQLLGGILISTQGQVPVLRRGPPLHLQSEDFQPAQHGIYSRARATRGAQVTFSMSTSGTRRRRSGMRLPRNRSASEPRPRSYRRRVTELT